MEIVAETDSRLMSLIEESSDDSALSDIAEGGKVKSKDIKAKIDEIMSNVHTPLIDELLELQRLLPSMKKKEYSLYINEHTMLEVAFTEKGTVTKASIANAIGVARTETSPPEAYSEDYAELMEAYKLSRKSEESTKIIKEMDKDLDEKARERYESLTDEEIIDLLVNKKWYYTIGTGINNLYAYISHQLADRIIELSNRYDDTLPELIKQTAEYETKVKCHLERMGFKW